MNKELSIRAEEKRDYDRIREIIVSAFADHPYSDQTEHLIVGELRHQQALALSLVAEVQETIAGHIAFSNVTIDGEECLWYGLAPVSVDPSYQGQGIGSALIREGLRRLRTRGARGCVLVGEPEYYTRFGFREQDSLVYPGVPEEFFLALSFEGEVPAGEVQYHPAFKAFN